MGWWVPEPTVAPSERVRWARGANREQRSTRHVGGRIFLTSDRLIFQPSRLDAFAGGRPWSAGLAKVAEFGIEPRQPTVAALIFRTGRLRNRLRVELRDGQVELFIINRLATTVHMLTAALNEYRQR